MKNKFQNSFFIVITFVLFLLSSIQCAKTDDVQPIENNTVDTTGNSGGIDTTGNSGGNFTYSGFILNEVLYDPPANMPGDANGDGTRDPNEDEFIEFVNDSDSAYDLSGHMIFDAANFSSGIPNHVFPNNTIVNPGQSVVVFGGGSPVGTFGGAQVFVSSNAVMNLNNSGDIMTFTDSLQNILIEFDISPYSNNPNESYTRSPEITGNFTQHDSVANGVLFSPGTKANGSPF